VQVVPYGRALLARRRYRLLTESELRSTRRGETVFVFGSGASLNAITPEEWEHIAAHDTFGFNWFVREDFVRCDYHLIRGIPDSDFDPGVWRPQLDEYFRLARTNPHFAKTVFLVQAGLRATNGNRAIGSGLLPPANPVFLWRTADRDAPGMSFADGLAHGSSTLHEAVNAAFLMGWKRIVLVGVDLYDRRYFWLPPDRARSVDEARGATVDDVHSTDAVVRHLGDWRTIFAQHGVELLVYRESSLLSAALDVYRA
jgi:hypothetical protein